VDKERATHLNVFPVEIDIKETSAKSSPGLTVSCRIIIGKVENALMIPVDAVHTLGDESFVYLKVASGFEKRIIQTAERNKDYMVVTGGLKEGDKLALSNPFGEEATDDKEGADESVPAEATQEEVL